MCCYSLTSCLKAILYFLMVCCCLKTLQRKYLFTKSVLANIMVKGYCTSSWCGIVFNHTNSLVPFCQTITLLKIKEVLICKPRTDCSSSSSIANTMVSWLSGCLVVVLAILLLLLQSQFEKQVSIYKPHTDCSSSSSIANTSGCRVGYTPTTTTVMV